MEFDRLYVRDRINSTNPRGRQIVRAYMGTKDKPGSVNRRLTDEFGDEICQLTVGYIRNTRISALRIPNPNIAKADYHLYGLSVEHPTPDNWRDFHRSLTKGQKKALSSVLYQAIKAGFRTVGAIRDASEEDLRKFIPKGRTTPAVSETGAKFLKRAFGPPYEGMLERKGEFVVFR